MKYALVGLAVACSLAAAVIAYLKVTGTPPPKPVVSGVIAQMPLVWCHAQRGEIVGGECVKHSAQ